MKSIEGFLLWSMQKPPWLSLVIFSLIGMWIGLFILMLCYLFVKGFALMAILSTVSGLIIKKYLDE